MYNHPFLTKQLIAYIGNKRTLLPFLSSVFDGFDIKHKISFLDPFAGSGAVSRLGKFKGYRVSTNDWESYSYVFNSCFIGVNKSNSLFEKSGGIKKIFNDINSLNAPFTPYISKHYAPESTNEADYITERLFYTKENAVFIDRARSYIEDLYPESRIDDNQRKEKSILLASLLYEVSTHANTSGVFKACHKGFGGHGKDALSRILAPMVMEIPNLINSDFTHNVTQMDALDFVKSNSGDICYLDPPYNMHQYGSNYFMLNTVALWDKPNVNQKRGADGRFVEKAGIRKDWKNTKSPYCYKSQAPGSFANLMDNIDSRYIVLSYNTEGIIPFEELFEIMERHGKVDLHIKDYVLYRGGKQSLSRKNHNMELLLVVDRQSRKGVSDRTNVERFLNNRKVLNQLKMPYNPGRLRAEFQFDSKGLCILNPTLGGVKVFKDYTFLEQPDNLNKLSETEFTELCNKLDRAQCTNNNEECEVLISLLEKEEDLRIVSKLQKRFLVVYKKLAFKKYIAVFNDITRIIEGKIGLQESNFIDLKDKTHEIKEIAKLRFEG